MIDRILGVGETMIVGQVFNPYRLFYGAFIPNAIMRYKGISATAKLVYARLVQFAGDKGEAWPKLETLAEEVGANERTVRRCISELEKEGFIKVERPTGTDKLNHKASVYKFLWHQIFEETDIQQCDNARSEPDKMSGPEWTNDPSTTGQNVRSNIRDSYKENHKENILPRNRKQKVYDEDNPYYRMAKYFYDRVKAVARELGLEHLTIKANLQTWADEMRKLVELDGVTDKKLIKDVMDWVTTDPFWRRYVLSATTLREKFSSLAIKMRADRHAQNNKVVPFIRHKEKDEERIDKEIAWRNKEIAFQKWVMAGNDPNTFDWS